jgi:hypothetical protein
MSEINIVRTIKPKKGDYIAEGRYEYVGKQPYGEGREGHFVLFKVLWRGGFFRSQNSLLVLPDLCVGVSLLSDKKVQSEARWGAFSAGQQSTPIGFGALGGLIAGAARSALASTKGLTGLVVYYSSELDKLVRGDSVSKESIGGIIAAASPDIVEEILSVIPEQMIFPIPGEP